MGWRKTILIVVLVALTAAGVESRRAAAESRVSIGVTETMETFNPYGDSVSLLYGIWCQVMGCLGTYDFNKGDYVGMLAEKWEVKDPNNWIFHLRKDIKWHDGSPFTAEDVVHSFNRARNDPQSKQTQNIAPIASASVVDKNTVRFTTKQPTAPLPEYLFDRLIITNHAIYEKYGAETADRKYPIGAGPYKFKELIPGQRFVIAKNPDYPGMKQMPQAPDEIVYRVLREDEQRVTALLNGELQIAQFIPPHLKKRVDSEGGTKSTTVDSVEIMFLAMQPKPPFDKKEVRQAVCHAIDRDRIINTVLQGLATRLDGPIGPGQYGYDPNLKPKYDYNPEKSKKLLAQAGYPNGVDVELETPVGRYTLDKQLNEVITQMLNSAGFRAKLATPEWATLWSNVQAGKVPFYYMGRGSIVDPSVALSQYFETGGSPRIGYSNPKLDKLLATERQTFEPAKRKKILAEAMSLITEEAPACFMWRHKMIYGMAKQIDYKPTPSGRIFGEDIRVLK
ncbi:MAG TPA: ABC transporter substrate-binding protein [Verrucomicrobiae bacterium]|nr:ABC transporter substrate-binding protein [Verrucomicrobiae bacterium]